MKISFAKLNNKVFDWRKTLSSSNIKNYDRIMLISYTEKAQHTIYGIGGQLSAFIERNEKGELIDKALITHDIDFGFAVRRMQFTMWEYCNNTTEYKIAQKNFKKAHSQALKALDDLEARAKIVMKEQLLRYSRQLSYIDRKVIKRSNLY